MKYIKSLIHPISIKEFVHHNYDLENNFRCTLLYTGIGDHYLIETTNSKFVLRVYLPEIYFIEGKSNFIYETEWTNHIKDNVSIIYPFMTKTGEYISEIDSVEGKRYCILYSFAEGKYIKPPQEKHAEIFAKNLALMHKYGKNFTPSVQSPNRGYSYFLEENVSVLESYQLQNPNDILPKLLLKMRHYKEIFDGIGSIPADDYIWGDSHYGNCLYTDEDKVTFIDLDFCGQGYKIFDIASYLWGFKLDNAKNYDQIEEKFLTQYESIYPLTNNEREAITVMILIRNIDTLVFQIQFNSHYLGSYARCERFWKEWYDDITRLEKVSGLI